jgi:integrase
MNTKITKTAVDRLKPGAILADISPIGFVARKLPSGAVTYGYRFREKHSGRQRWIGLGIHGELTPDQARRKALKVAAEVKDGRTPASAAATAAKRRVELGVSVNDLLDKFISRHARPNLRSASEIERSFVDIRRHIGGRSIYEVGRKEVIEALDVIDDRGAKVMADRVLAHLRSAFNWYAARDEHFKSPLVKGMARTKPIARDRTLSDEELRDLWRVLDTAQVPARFPALVRTLLLTVARRDECARMSWSEIAGDTWTIPAERYKSGRAVRVPLTQAVLELLGPRQTGYVFSSNGGSVPISGFSKAKRSLDAAIDGLRQAEGREPMPPWRLHDLRRTGRSLMSRAQVPSDHAERTLGHVIAGIRGTYDTYDYLPEKKAALERLAGLVRLILDEPDPEKVVALNRRKG